MQYIATKNQNKSADNHPDYRLYQKDANGEIIKEEYTKKDGTTGMGWKGMGALWINRKDDGTVTMNIQIDDQKTQQAPNPAAQMDALTNSPQNIAPVDPFMPEELNEWGNA